MRTLLLGLDGATFTVLDPLMDQGVMPFLKEFLAAGARAGLRTIVPALTPPAWTSMVTGRKPGRHGVFDFFRPESAGSRHIRFFASTDVGCDTIWTLASRSGRRVTSLNFPAMFPPPKISGYVVPGWVPWRQLRLACWPEDLVERLKGNVPEFNQRELAMDIKLEGKATEGVAANNEYIPWIDLHIRRERNWFDIFRYLHQADPADLTGILFDGVDKLQHLCWRFLRPEDARPLHYKWEFAVREHCLEYFRQLDHLIRGICELAGPETTVIIASDHGFGPTWEVFYLNAWLARKGYLEWARDGAAAGDEQATLGVNQVARHTYLLDWTKTTAYATTPTSNGLHIAVNRNGNEPGIPPEQYEGLRERLIRDLEQVKDPKTGERVVREIYTREQIFPGPHMDVGPDLTLVLRDHGLISILPSRKIVGKRKSVAGAHRPVGVLGVRGPGIRAGLKLEEVSILDVAPLALYAMGLAAPAGVEGRVPAGLYKESWLRAQPIAPAAPEAPEAASTEIQAAAMSAEDEAEVLERMRELGYIE